MELDFSSLLTQSLNSKLTTMLLQRMYQSSTATNLAVPDSTRRAFASQMRVDSRVAVQGAQNMQDAAAMVTVAQTDVTMIKQKLGEMRELTIEMANKEALDPTDFAAAESRLKQLSKEIVAVTGNSSFNGISLLDGKAGMNNDGKIQLQAGNSSMDQVMTNLVDTSLAGAPTTAGGQEVTAGGKINLNNLEGNMNMANQADAEEVLKVIESAYNAISSVEAQYSYDIKSLNNMSVLLMGQADIFEGAMKNHQTPKSTDDGSQNNASKTALSDFLGSGGVMNILG